MTRATLALLTIALLAACCAIPRAAGADVSWLCRPGIEDNPCQGDQTTTYVSPGGGSRVATPKVPARPPVDCFYVYPTVSNQPTPNATKSPDPEVRSIALFQAQRFSTRCRIFAPLYRQVTAAGVSTASQTHDTKGYDTAYSDVREAWLDYLRHDNGGRGVVLVGHSQGSRMLRALIRREIDPNAAVRRRLVSAVIPGANATTDDFGHIPACAREAQTGCVLSWSTFNETPPDNSRFGRTDTDPVGGALGLPAGSGRTVICTDPAKLAGHSRLSSLVPTAPFAPGVIAALLVKLYGGPPPTADPPWLQPSDHYTGRCETSNGANVLMIAPVGNARMLNPSPDDTWGVHLVDLNLAMGDVLDVVGAQTRAYLGARRPLAVRLRIRATHRRSVRLVASVSGPPRARVRLALRSAGRSVRLGRSGRARAGFTVRRAGSYRVTARRGAHAVRSGRVRVKLP
jgi:hypothetical protein